MTTLWRTLGSSSETLRPSHLVILSRGVLDDLHGRRQRGVSLLVLLLLPAALHPGGRLREEVTVLTEHSLKVTDSIRVSYKWKNHFLNIS